MTYRKSSRKLRVITLFLYLNMYIYKRISKSVLMRMQKYSSTFYDGKRVQLKNWSLIPNGKAEKAKR